MSPLADKHFNVLGRYRFTVTDSILRGDLRPLRDPNVSVAELRAYEWSSYPKFFKRKPPEPLRRGRFLSALEFGLCGGDGAIYQAIGVRRGERSRGARLG